MYPVDYTKRIYCVITGASRGIGRQIAIELACKSTNKLTLILLARCESGLLETKALITQIKTNVTVITYALDLSEANAENYKKILQETFQPEFDSAIVFHNAGQIGTIKKASELSQKEEWGQYYELNVVSVAVLNSVFLKTVEDVKQVFVINITSLLGRKAFKYFSMYGSAKAARDQYFKILAEEEPKIVVLNYSPGMVDTNMSSELISNIKSFEDSEITTSLKENPTRLTPKQTTNKMFAILEQAAFNSGDIIDYYD